MPLINLVDPSSLSGPAREVADSGIAQYGTALNTWRAIMNKPDMFATYLPFLRQVAGPGELDGQIKDLSALYVGYLNNCQYTVSHRATSAAAKGIPDDVMRVVVSEQWDDLDPKLQLALTLTKELTLNPTQVRFSEAPQVISPALQERLTTHFSDTELLELSMSVSMWNALSRFHRVMGFDLDMPIAPEGVNPQ
jgi:alkylhydroperoxidase family enzyme